MLFLPQGNTALACPYAPKSPGHRRVEGGVWCPTGDQPQPSSTPSFAAPPSGSRPKGETASPCSSTRVLPAAACRHVLPRTQVLLLTQTAPSVCPDPLVPQCSNHGPPQALPVPISPFPAQKPKVVMGLGSAPRWDLGRKACSEPPESCRGWILHKRMPRRDKSIASVSRRDSGRSSQSSLRTTPALHSHILNHFIRTAHPPGHRTTYSSLLVTF